MTALHVMVPDEVQAKALEVAQRQHITIDDLTTMALVEKLSAMIPDPYLEARAKRGDRKKFDAVMAGVPHVEPEERDRLR